ncbi:MAG: DUF1080 domain-containing protein [Lentisphaeraceae bacterium]|nr:DUF1080 domain-containing protein [Lentisphaeraceae bacterium]
MLKKTCILLFFISLATLIAGDKKPDGAIQFISKTGIKRLVNERSPEKPLTWSFANGVLTATKGHITTDIPVKDFKAHIEFNVNHKPGNPGNDGNSGIYIQQRYEVQILNSFGRDEKYSHSDCAALYKFKKPDQIVCKPAGEWQSYDIEFQSARWKDGKKTANARITLFHNGVLVHDDVELPNSTGRGKTESPEAYPLRLQYHGNEVKFRNFWLKETNK